MLNCQFVSSIREEIKLLHQWVHAYARNGLHSLWITLPLYLNCKRLTGAIILPMGNQSCFILLFRSWAPRLLPSSKILRRKPHDSTRAFSVFRAGLEAHIFSRRSVLKVLLRTGFPWHNFGPNKITIWHPLPPTKGFCYSLGREAGFVAIRAFFVATVLFSRNGDLWLWPDGGVEEGGVDQSHFVKIKRRAPWRVFVPCLSITVFNTVYFLDY